MTNEQLKELQDNFAQAITGHPVVIDEQIEYVCYDPAENTMPMPPFEKDNASHN